MPSLSIFIDEVHHAVSSADKTQERKLRAVVTRWTESGAINSVIGFSGTPYLEKAEKIAVKDGLSVATAEITNTVYYYPLVNGVGNFLKRPIVKISDVADSARIIDSGVWEFLDTYKDTVYSDDTTAKLGIKQSCLSLATSIPTQTITNLQMIDLMLYPQNTLPCNLVLHQPSGGI